MSQLRDLRADRVVLLTNSFKTAWLAWRSGAPERIGIARDGRSLLLTTKLFEPRRKGKRLDIPAIDSYLNLAYAAGGSWQPPTLQLETTPKDQQQADHVWQKLGLPDGDRVIVFNSGGAFGAAKNWPAEHFAELARRLVHLDYSVLVNCGPAERDTARDIVRQASSERVVSLADWPSPDAWDVPLGLSKAVIQRSRLLVSTDSGPRFFAIAFGKPVVTLFGPTGVAATRTHYEQEIPLSLNLECQPCMKPSCPLSHHRCMRDLSPSMVEHAIKQLLNQDRLAAA